ncbi:MAG: tetratricopeptide repeat protein [candidate division WOR-3 bacterium]
MRWLILVLFTTTTCGIFSKPNLYQQGVRSYEQKDYEKAIKYFTSHYQKSPSGDSTLFFLYNCYLKTGNYPSAIKILEKLARRKNPHPAIYLNLYQYYRHQRLYYKIPEMLSRAPKSALQKIDREVPLTRRCIAELLTGICTAQKIDDPIGFAIKKGFIKPSADGKLYENDTIKIYQLILYLDSFLPPVKPEKLLHVKNIRPDSYLYYPYSRLVSFGILEPDAEIDPQAYGTLSFLQRALINLKNLGYLK